MLKRIILFVSFLLAGVAVYARGAQLLLSYYVLLPLLLFPIFYFFEKQDRFFLLSAAFIFIAVSGAYLFRHQTPEMIFFGVGHLGAFAALCLYRNRWTGTLRFETVKRGTALKEWETLKHKHSSRLESLHHLEKQVSSLMNLFEMARDFSEHLDFEALAGLLHKKVMPELSFRQMRLILFRRAEGDVTTSRLFTINAEGMREGGMELTSVEAEGLERVRESKQIQKKDSLWIFPLLMEDETTALLTVDGAEQDDFPKFEVLVAHLVLQVKKIRLYETVKELSIMDGLTGVFVRRYFLERFEEELKRCIKHHLSLAVLMLDIDHFKSYNDDFGHVVGDATLKEVAFLLRASLRNVDIVGRFGGEEFIVVIPETQREGACEVAERIRSGIARHHFKVYDEETKVTVSVGAALFPDDVSEQFRASFQPELVSDLVQQSDKALYKAKEDGRNRVVFFQEL